MMLAPPSVTKRCRSRHVMVSHSTPGQSAQHIHKTDKTEDVDALGFVCPYSALLCVRERRNDRALILVFDELLHRIRIELFQQDLELLFIFLTRAHG